MSLSEIHLLTNIIQNLMATNLEIEDDKPRVPSHHIRATHPPLRHPSRSTSARIGPPSILKIDPNATARATCRSSTPQAFISTPRNSIRNLSPQVSTSAVLAMNPYTTPHPTSTVNLIPPPICDHPKRRKEVNAHMPSCLIASGLDPTICNISVR